MANSSLARPHVEYCSTIWDPYITKNINKLEMVQRRAARFVTGRYQYTDSVSSMLNELGWRSLENRRRDARLGMFYKIQNSLVSINLDEYLHPPHLFLRHSHNLSYQIPFSVTDAHKFSFVPRTVCQWNSLPSQTVNLPSLTCFRGAISKT